MELELCRLLLLSVSCLCIGILPSSTGQLVSPVICTYGTRRYTILGNSSFNPGDIFKFAEECATSFNGSLYGFKNLGEADGLVRTIDSAGCRPQLRVVNDPYFGTGGKLYVGPSASSRRNEMPSTRGFTASEVRKFWLRVDGTSLDPAHFTSPQPDNWGGTEACLHLLLKSDRSFMVNDLPCITAPTNALCVVDAPASEKGCPKPPIDPTAGTPTAATVSISPMVQATPPYYPFRSVANFTCPCGYKWTAPSTTIKPSNLPAEGLITTTVQAECYGTIGWTTYDVTACESAVTYVTNRIAIEWGMAKVIFNAFQGNHSDAAARCKQQGATMTLPVLTTAADFQNLVRLLDLWPCIRGPEIPIAQNVMLKLTPTTAANETAFVELWLTVFSNRSWWHSGEPAYNKSNLGGCAVFALRNGTWKLGVKNCSESSSSNSFLCVDTTYSGNLTSCSKESLESGKAGGITSFSGGYPITTNSIPLETIATQGCDCGKVYVDTEGSMVFTTQSKCQGILGWIPSKITECVKAPEFLDDNENRYTVGHSDSGYGITEAATVCNATTNGRGSIAELRSRSQAILPAFLMKAHCIDDAFVAPTAWKYMNASLQAKGRHLTGTDIGTVWRFNDGALLGTDPPFYPGNPENTGGIEQCLKLRVDLSSPGLTYSLIDIWCWDRNDGARHICAEPLNNGTLTTNTSYCFFPTNPTATHQTPATMEYDPADIFISGNQSSPQQRFNFGSVVNYTCPDGYSWTPVRSWPTNSVANTVSTKIRTKVSVKCFGTLGWTLYDVTECGNATACGPLPPTPPNVNQSCGATANDTAYECLRVCSGYPYAWISGASSHTLSCNSSTNLWSVSEDYCEPHCDAGEIQTYPGVSRNWDGTHRLDSNVTYYCEGNNAFYANASLANTTYVSKCQANGEWSSLPAFQLACSPYRCNSSHIPTFQGVLQRGNIPADSLIGAKVTYYCQDSYSFWGNASAANEERETTCQKNGTWSASVPANLECRVYKCNASAIPRAPSGAVESRNWTISLVGVTVSFSCPEGTAFDGNASTNNALVQSTCQSNGNWTTLPFDKPCKPVVCDASQIKTFQGVLLTGNRSGEYLVGSKVTYSCQDSYSFWGNTSAGNEVLEMTCQKNGTWSSIPANLECRIYKCNASIMPSAPSGAVESRNWTVSLVGVSVYYSCREGSAFDGSASMWNAQLQSTCLSDGTWTSLAFNKPCKPFFCNASQINLFQGVTLSQGSVSVGSTATYSCPAYGTKLAMAVRSNGTLVGSRMSTFSVTCQNDATWSQVPDDRLLVCSALGFCDPAELINDNYTSQYVGLQVSNNGTNQIGDVAYQLYMDYAEMWTCQSNGWGGVRRVPKWFPERIPVPTLPSYPVDFVETTLYHWGRAVENATCTGCLTGNISAPIESPGPTQFGQGVEIRGWDNECLEDNDFERRANFTCFANPMTCANGSNGISMGFFYKRGIPMKDVYLVYFNPKNSSANYPTKETLVSSGGDREGHPGIHVWWEGPFLGVLVSTGELYWEVLFLPKLFNDTWNNIGFRWFRPTPGVDDDGRLEVLINVEQQAATNQAKRASRVQSMLLPPTMLMGCHKDSTNTQKRFYGEGFFDEVAFWDTFIFDNTSRMFAGGYLPELNGVPTSVILDSIRESAKLEDERTRQVAWIAVQSIASDTNMTSEPVRPADAALNKTGETPSQQVENLVKFVTTLQSAEYISSSNSIGAVAKAARTSMSATSTLLSGNRHAWEEIADAGYKPGAYALVKSQNDYFMNMADSIAVDTKMTSAQMIDVTSDEIVSKLGVARIGHLRQSPTLKFPNYEDEIWGNGSMSKKFDYPVDTIEVPLGLYFPSSKTCDGTNLVNIEMNAYKNLDDFMPPNKVNPLKIVSQDNVIDSNILYFAFTLNKNIPKAKVAGCQPDALAMISNPIKLLFRHKMDEPAQEAGFKSRKLKFHTEEVEYNIKVRRCVWWNPSMNEFGGWDPSGCNIYDTADNFTMCECAAQGLFGILGEMIQHYELPTEPTWLTVVKFVGYGLSILCLPLFIVIVLKSKDHLHDQFHIMRANLAFALLVGLILHCISDLHSIRDSRHACTAISVMFHYFYTAAGAWFCFESYASFVAITQGIIGGKLRAYIPLCWGLPFLSVGAALIQDMLSYGTDPRCMISFDNEMKWIFFGPLLTFASIGFLLSAIVICNISTPALRKDHIADELVSVGQGLAAQVTYFLCTWIAGVCAYFIYDWTIETPGFYALFQVLNAYTGVFYLVFMGFISLRFRMVVLGVAQKRKLMILQYLTRNQHEQLKPTPSVDNQQSDELPDELFAEGGPSSGRRKILTST